MIQHWRDLGLGRKSCPNVPARAPWLILTDRCVTRLLTPAHISHREWWPHLTIVTPHAKTYTTTSNHLTSRLFYLCIYLCPHDPCNFATSSLLLHCQTVLYTTLAISTRKGRNTCKTLSNNLQFCNVLLLHSLSTIVKLCVLDLFYYCSTTSPSTRLYSRLFGIPVSFYLCTY